DAARFSGVPKQPPPPPTPPQRDPRSAQSVTPRSPGGGTPAEIERAMALRDVMQHAVREQREITDPKPLDRRRSRRIVVAIVCVALLALSAYSWLARPEFIWGPSARSVPVERRDASLRFT